jgi:Zn-dependent protease
VNSFSNLIQTIVIYALPVLFAITAHEAAHGFVAQKLGDNTAAMLGRVTLNPVRHIDPIGTIAIPLALLVLALITQAKYPFLFGYAKPVPVRLDRLKNPRRDMVWVALAGPLCNLVQALIWGALFYLLSGMGVREPFFLSMCVGKDPSQIGGGVGINGGLFVFNLFPLLPLDGGRVLAGLLPSRAAITFSRIEPYGFFIVMALVLSGFLVPIWMDPLMHLTLSAIDAILSPLRALLS